MPMEEAWEGSRDARRVFFKFGIMIRNACALSLPYLQSPIYEKCAVGGRPKFDHRNYPALSRRSELPKSYGCNHLVTSQETIMGGRI